MSLFPTVAQANAQGMALATALGCSDLACLRTKDPSMLGKALGTVLLNFGDRSKGASWWPVVPSPLVAFESGSFNKVPVIIGTNGDEGTFFQLLGGPATEADYTAAVQAQWGANAPQVLAQYPVANYPTTTAAAAAVLGDVAFVSDARRTARALVAAGVPVWRYSFEHVPANQPLGNLGSYHGGEIAFVFDSVFERTPLTAVEETLGSVMRDHWVAMARDGNPGSDWPAYDASTDPYLEFNNGAVAKMGLKTAISDFWDSLQ
jgi:para-nitrobenzyl esterase